MNIDLHKAEIQELLAAHDITKAIKRSMDFVKDFSDQRDLLNQIIVISSNYNRISQGSKSALTSIPGVDDPQLNRLLFNLLELLDKVEDDFLDQN